MKTLKAFSRYAAASLATLALVACIAPTNSDESSGVGSDAIVNGTPQALGANSFVRLPVAGCTGTLLANNWALIANHCTTHVGDSVLMDAQATTVTRVVPNDVSHGVDIALIKLASPFYINGTNTGFRRYLRSDTVLPGGHIRCFGYGKTNPNLLGIDPQLRLMELKTAGGASDVYSLIPNALHQSATPGDAGGACLDDNGYAIGIMKTFTQAPDVSGETYMISSHAYEPWAQIYSSGGCYVGSDCPTSAPICSASHACVASHCQDGWKDSGETGIDCGGTCAACPRPHCPAGMLDCGDGNCVKKGFQCP